MSLSYANVVGSSLFFAAVVPKLDFYTPWSYPVFLPKLYKTTKISKQPALPSLKDNIRNDKTMVTREHPVVGGVTVDKYVCYLPVPTSDAISPQARSTKSSSTHHPPSLPPNTKSIHDSSFLRFLNPVNVAHGPPTCRRGASTRRSTISSSESCTGKRRAKSSGTRGAGCAPVSTAYAPSSSPIAELFASCQSVR